MWHLLEMLIQRESNRSANSSLEDSTPEGPHFHNWLVLQASPPKPKTVEIRNQSEHFGKAFGSQRSHSVDLNIAQ